MSRKVKHRGLTMRKATQLKKDASITVHMPQVIKERLSRLADLQRSGQGVSEHLYENLIIPYLEQLEAETKIKQKIFDLVEN